MKKAVKNSAPAVPPAKCGGPKTESPKQSATSRTFDLLRNLNETEQKKALVLELFNGVQTHSYDPCFEEGFEYGGVTLIPEKPLSVATWIEYTNVCPSLRHLLNGADKQKELRLLFQELVGTLVSRTTFDDETLFIRFLSDGIEGFFFVVTHP